MDEENKAPEEPQVAEKPKPKPNQKPQRDLPVNPRDMTPGRRGEYQTR